MDVRWTEEQELLRRSARALLARECPVSEVRARMEAPNGADDPLWKRLGEVGWLGLLVPEELGGEGLGFLEGAVLLEEMGRVLLPLPFLASVVLAGGALAVAGDAVQRGRWLPALARGALRATVALLEDDERWDAGAVALAARPAAGGWLLSGRKRFVLDAASADLLLVAARREGELALAAVGARQPGVTVRPTASLDATRGLAEVRLEDVSVAAEDVLALGEDGLERLLDRARVALCAEMVGGAEAVLEASVAYARTREQFGRPIGTFQAIQHRCADMLVALEGARSATWWAAWAIAEAEREPCAEHAGEAHLASLVAKACASEAFARIAADGIQVHGGLGFTWEQDLHLFYRRAKVSERLFGDPAACREALARGWLDTGRRLASP
jgi:alkylation response protein AidB-like acyl-CoA dehydrogenase